MQERYLEEIDKEEFLSYGDREVIFQENSLGKEIYVIEDGKVEISQLVAGERIVLTELEKGSLFGEMSAITGSPRSATAKAIGNVSLRRFSMDKIMEYMKIDHALMQTVVQRLIGYLRNSTSTLGTMSLVNKRALEEESDDGEGIGILMECCENLQKMINCLGRRMEQKDRQIEGLRRQLDQRQVGVNEWNTNATLLGKLVGPLGKKYIPESISVRLRKPQQRLEPTSALD